MSYGEGFEKTPTPTRSEPRERGSAERRYPGNPGLHGDVKRNNKISKEREKEYKSQNKGRNMTRIIFQAEKENLGCFGKMEEGDIFTS